MTERTNQIINNDNARSKKNKKNEFIESVGVFGVMEFFVVCVTRPQYALLDAFFCHLLHASIRVSVS